MSTAFERDLVGAIDEAVAGDEAAFARIVAAHDDDMARVAYLVCGDVTLAHEAVPSAWERAWRRLGSLRDREHLRAWLVAIAANETRQLIRQRWRRSVVEITVEAFDEVGPRAARPDGLPDRHLDLMAAVQRLDPEDREIIAMRYALGFTSSEIGAATGRSAAGVRSRLARALGRLREDLGDD